MLIGLFNVAYKCHLKLSLQTKLFARILECDYHEIHYAYVRQTASHCLRIFLWCVFLQFFVFINDKIFRSIHPSSRFPFLIVPLLVVVNKSSKITVHCHWWESHFRDDCGFISMAKS